MSAVIFFLLRSNSTWDRDAFWFISFSPIQHLSNHYLVTFIIWSIGGFQLVTCHPKNQVNSFARH